ncbi:hypothetical protein ACKFKF_09825 [Phormidesmis sp. 146-12]
MESKILVVLEGQQHWIDAEIAQSDELLRQLFSTLSPELAGAEIKRRDSRIDLIPRKGTKGSNLLEVFNAAAIEINPGVECCLALQQLELRVGIDTANAGTIAQQIESALEQSKKWEQALKTTLHRLDQASSHSIVPLGF